MFTRIQIHTYMHTKRDIHMYIKQKTIADKIKIKNALKYFELISNILVTYIEIF